MEICITYTRADQKADEGISSNCLQYGDRLTMLTVCEGILQHPDYKAEFKAECVSGRWSGVEIWEFRAPAEKWQEASRDPRFEIQFPAMERM